MDVIIIDNVADYVDTLAQQLKEKQLDKMYKTLIELVDYLHRISNNMEERELQEMED